MTRLLGALTIACAVALVWMIAINAALLPSLICAAVALWVGSAWSHAAEADRERDHRTRCTDRRLRRELNRHT